MAQVINLLELQLASGAVYWSTHETLPDGTSVVDGSGNVYERRLKSWPKVTRKLSDAYFGIPEDGTLTCEVGALDQADSVAVSDWNPAAQANAIASLFRAADARGRSAILRRLVVNDDGTTTLTDRFSGIVESREFQDDGSVQLTIIDQSTAVLETAYPRLTIDTDTYPKAIDERFAVGATRPIHLGAHREHSPCRYVEGTDRTGWTATDPHLLSTHRYVVGCDLAATVNGYANVAPHVNALYLGTDLGASLINPGEYTLRRDRYVTMTAPAISLQSGGSLAASALYAYEISAWNGVRESPVQSVGRALSAAEVTANTRTLRLTWARPAGALGYFIRRNTVLLAFIGNGNLTSFDDNGTLTPIVYDNPQPINLTGQNVLEAVFSGAQKSKSDTLAPVLADVECTEMGWAPDVTGLWHFRADNGAAIHDAKPQQQNYLRRSTTVGFWTFNGSGTSQLPGINDLEVNYATVADYVSGRNGKAALLGQGTIYATITNAAQDGNLNRGTSNTLIAALVRPDNGTSNRANMTIVEKGNGAAGNIGYSLKISEGYAKAHIGDGTTTVTVTGATPLDGAWHLVELVINRTTQTLYLRVDGLVDSSAPSIAAVGSLNNAADFTVLAGIDGNFYGAIDWLLIDTNVNPLTFLRNGKANSGPSAFDIESSPTQKPLYLDDASSVGLEIVGSFTGEFWGYHTVGPGGTLKVAVQKFDGAIGGYKLGVINSSGFDRFQVQINNAGTTTTVTGVGVATTNTWHHYAVVQGGGVITLYQDGGVVGSSTPASTVGGDNAQPFIIGATDTGGTNRFPGAIDEVRITQRARTAAEIREAYFLGMRNPVRQLRTLLTSAAHGPGLTCNATTWDQAEADLATAGSSKLVTDLALVESAPLRSYIVELMKVRGLRLSINTSGAYDCTIDTQQAPSGSFGWQDGGDADAPMSKRPVWSQRALKEAPKTLRAKYRRRRNREGSLDRYALKTSDRAVLSVGLSDAQVIELMAVRDTEAADRVANYYQQRAILADFSCQFATGGDGFALDIGDVVRLYDPSSGLTSTGELHEIVSLTESGQQIDVETRAWSSAIYTYTAGTLPFSIGPESEADYSATLPPVVTNFAVTFAPTIAAHGATFWTPTATWTAPTSTNVGSVVVEWRPASETPWRPLGILPKSFTTMKGDGSFDDATAYQFRIYARSKFALDGPATIISVSTTQPGAPANVSGMAVVGSGHRSRRWKWTKNTEKNIVGYDFEVRNAASGGGSLFDSGTLGGNRSSFTWTSGSIAIDQIVYLRLKARNASGQLSASWSELASSTADPVTGGSGGDLGNNGTVATTDAGTDVFTKVGSTTGTATISGSSFSSIVSRSQATAGGVALVMFTGLIQFQDPWSAVDHFQIEVRKNSTQQVTAVYSGIATQSFENMALPFTYHWLDTSPGTGTNTYDIRGKISAGNAGHSVAFDVRCTVLELKR